MKLASLFALFFITFFSTSHAEDKAPSCSTLMSEAKKSIVEMTDNMKAGKDIDVVFNLLEKKIKQHPSCLSFKKLKLTTNQVAQFRAYTYTPDRTFNLKRQDCTEYKVETTHMPKNNDQGPLGWCFAFSATDLLSFHEKTRLSAYDVALTNYVGASKNDDADITDAGGFPEEALKYAINSPKGICLENEVNYTGGDWEKLSAMMKNLATPGKNLSQIVCENQFNEKEAFANLSQDVINILDQMTAEKRAEGVLDVACKNRHMISKKYTIVDMSIEDTTTQYTSEDIVNALDKVLEKGEPVAIGYASELLSAGVNFHGNPDHESTLIGRKYNPESGQCEYLIKNSWGGGDCQQTSSIKCEDGNFWVPRTALKNNLDSAAWIKEN